MPREPIRTWDECVFKTIKKKAMHVESDSPPELVGRVEKNKEYILYFAIENKSLVELEYEKVHIRLCGQANQVEFIDPPGVIVNGQPRVLLKAGGLSMGEYRSWMVRFKALKTMATKNLKFLTGVFGILVPEGHYWKTLTPKP